MIKVDIKTKQGKIVLIKVEGHANYSNKGKDIVCAGVSAVIIGGANSFEKEIIKKQVYCKIDQDIAKIKVEDYTIISIQNKLDVIVTQLKAISENYSKYVKIKKEEI